MSSTPKPTTLSKSKSQASSSSKFDETAWFKQWNGFEVRLRHCHQAIQEIFNAGTTYWKSLDERVRSAASQHKYGLDSSTISKFDGIARVRKTYLESPPLFLDAYYRDFEAAYADARFLKNTLGALIYGVPQVDPSSVSGARAQPSSSTATKATPGSLMPKLDSASRAMAQPSSTSTNAQGSLMPRLDASRMPSQLSPSTARATTSLSTPPQAGNLSLVPARDTRPGFSTSSSQQVFADGSGMRRETHERRVLPPTVGTDGVIVYGIEERIHVNVQQIRMTEQVEHQRVVYRGPVRYSEYQGPSGRFPSGAGGHPGGMGGGR